MIYKMLSYTLTLCFYLLFLIILLVFHLFQFIGYNLFGYRAQNLMSLMMSYFTMQALKVLGTRFTFEWVTPIPENTPLIIISNHQSTYEIPPIVWYLRKHHPKFISKKQLGKGIPGVSYNLRHGGSVLIDRKKRKDSLIKIKHFGEKVDQNKWSAVIFPEGTRSKTGVPKKFQKGGLVTLMESMPNALIVPISIKNSWKLAKYNYMPMPLGVHLKIKVHTPIPNDLGAIVSLIENVETQIHQELQSA